MPDRTAAPPVVSRCPSCGDENPRCEAVYEEVARRRYPVLLEQDSHGGLACAVDGVTVDGETHIETLHGGRPLMVICIACRYTGYPADFEPQGEGR